MDNSCVIQLYNFILFSDVGEIWFRLFDHRPFISGEIKFFLKEFEVRSHKFKAR